MRRLAFSGLALACAACASDPLADIDCVTCLEDVTVLAAAAPPFVTGLAGPMWATIDARRDTGRALTYFLMYGGQDLPQAGDRCELYWEWTVIEGLTDAENIAKKLKPVVGDVRCGDSVYTFGHQKGGPSDADTAPH
jgi:hypothetical protein